VNLNATDLSQSVTLREEDLPALYHAANQNSMDAQKSYLRRTAAGLIMLLIAAGAGSFSLKVDELTTIGLTGVIDAVVETFRMDEPSTLDLTGIIAAVAFSTAMLLRLYLLTDRPERTWYGGRAAAESARTLAWRYSVGAEPFGISRNPDEVDASLVQRLREILTDLSGTSMVTRPDKTEQITRSMRELRGRSLEERKEAYQVGRIEDQRDWYSRKGRWHKVRADRWNLALMFIEILGLVAAIMRAVGIMEIDVLGLAGAVVAAGASWLQTKQHSTLSQAYSVACQELSAISDLIPLQKSEETWARFVTEAEEAISREHTLWRASKTTL